MKKCNDCNIYMIAGELHTGFVGGARNDERIYLDYINGKLTKKNIFGTEKEFDDYVTEEVKVRVCPNCGKVENYINIENLNKIN